MGLVSDTIQYHLGKLLCELADPDNRVPTTYVRVIPNHPDVDYIARDEDTDNRQKVSFMKMCKLLGRMHSDTIDFAMTK